MDSAHSWVALPIQEDPTTTSFWSDQWVEGRCIADFTWDLFRAVTPNAMKCSVRGGPFQWHLDSRHCRLPHDPGAEPVHVASPTTGRVCIPARRQGSSSMALVGPGKLGLWSNVLRWDGAAGCSPALVRQGNGGTQVFLLAVSAGSLLDGRAEATTRLATGQHLRSM
jgi:hypothetical protein